MKWYRFTGDAGSFMPETCPPKGRCSAKYPGWLEGGHPTAAEGEVMRRVCFHGEGSCCASNNLIPVLNCNKYFLYKLTDTRDGDRYCGTDARKCFLDIERSYRVFSHDVTAAMLVSQNKEMAAMSVSQTKPLGIELYFYANTFFCFGKPIWPVVT